MARRSNCACLKRKRPKNRHRNSDSPSIPPEKRAFVRHPASQCDITQKLELANQSGLGASPRLKRPSAKRFVQRPARAENQLLNKHSVLGGNRSGCSRSCAPPPARLGPRTVLRVPAGTSVLRHGLSCSRTGRRLHQTPPLSVDRAVSAVGR